MKIASTPMDNICKTKNDFASVITPVISMYFEFIMFLMC